MTRTLLTKLCLLLGLFTVTFPLAVSAASNSLKPDYGHSGSEEGFGTLKAACNAGLKALAPEGTSLKGEPAEEPGFPGTFRCTYKDSVGDESFFGVYRYCPSNSDWNGSSCICRDTYVSDGKQCVAAGDTSAENAKAVSNPKALPAQQAPIQVKRSRNGKLVSAKTYENACRDHRKGEGCKGENS